MLSEAKMAVGRSAWVSSRSMAALIEHVVLNHQNPRSLGWVVQRLRGQLGRLHANDPHPLEDLSQRLQPPGADQLTRLCQSDHIGDFVHLQALLQQFMKAGAQLSTDISLRHFTHTGEVRRFLVGPAGCEVTGVTTTPDGKTMFVNIQHPGEPANELTDPKNPRAVSNWPEKKANGRPRSATVVIRKADGGVVGT